MVRILVNTEKKEETAAKIDQIALKQINGRSAIPQIEGGSHQNKKTMAKVKTI